jgi:hypothetical protein
VFLHQFEVFEFLEVIRSDGNIEAPNVPSIQTTMDIRRPELVPHQATFARFTSSRSVLS